MNDPATLDAFAGALQTLAEGLTPEIDALGRIGPAGDARRTSLEGAKARLESAASAVNDAAATAKLSTDAGVKLQALTRVVAAQADRIAADESSVKRFADLASKVLTLSGQLASGNIPAALGTAEAIRTQLG